MPTNTERYSDEADAWISFNNYEYFLQQAKTRTCLSSENTPMIKTAIKDNTFVTFHYLNVTAL